MNFSINSLPESNNINKTGSNNETRKKPNVKENTKTFLGLINNIIGKKTQGSKIKEKQVSIVKTMEGSVASNIKDGVLDLSGKKLSKKDLENVFAHLTTKDSQPVIKELNLKNVSIELKITGWLSNELSKALETNTTLEKLNLANTNLNDDKVEKIFKALIKNKENNLKELNLSENKFLKGDSYIEKYLDLNPKLETLNLNGTRLNDISCLGIFKSLKEENTNLHTLKLGDFNIGSGDCYIKDIFLSKKCITENGLGLIFEKLGNAKNLKTFEISETVLDKNSLSKLQESLSSEDLKLENLILSKCKFENTIGSKKVIINGQENFYDKENNDMIEGIKRLCIGLKNNKTLEKIDLSSTNIGDKGAKYLSSALKKNKSLKVINLDYTDIGNNGAEKIIKAIKNNKSIEKIKIDGTDVKSSIKKEISTMLKTKKDLKTIPLNDKKIQENDKTIQENYKKIQENELNLKAFVKGNKVHHQYEGYGTYGYNSPGIYDLESGKNGLTKALKELKEIKDPIALQNSQIKIEKKQKELIENQKNMLDYQDHFMNKIFKHFK